MRVVVGPGRWSFQRHVCRGRELIAEWGAFYGLDYLTLSGAEGFVTFQPTPRWEVGRYPVGAALSQSAPQSPGDTLVAEAGFRLLTSEAAAYRSADGVLVVESVSDEEIRGTVVLSGVRIGSTSGAFRVEGRFAAEHVSSRY